MPELPEVETIRAGLARTVAGLRVTDVEVLRDRSIRRHVGGEESFVAQLRGRRLSAVVRRGKFLWFMLDDGAADDGLAPAPSGLLAHLGMSGQLLVRTGQDVSPEEPTHPHLRVRLHFASSDSLVDAPNRGLRTLDFVDQRTFGHLLVDRLVPTADDGPGGLGSELTLLPASASHIARDLLDPTFDLDKAVATIRRKQSGIKRVLLDQQVVSGIGNIYADEALWRAGVHFARPTDRMRAKDVARVLEAAADVMTESLAQGGTSFDALYVDVAGESGYFARSLAVYGREGLPCPRCGTPIARVSFMNRSAHYCPRCQRAPRH